MRRSKKIFILLISTIYLISLVNASYILDFQTDPEKIEPDGSFSIVLELKSTDWGKKVKFFLDGMEFDSKNAGQAEEVESTDWDTDKNPIGCGNHTIRVEIYRTNTLKENETFEINIGSVPEMSVSPEQPLSGDKVTLEFTDPETNDQVDGANVVIRKLRDLKAEPIEKQTDAAGEVSLFLSDLGEYEVDLVSEDYCLTRSIWVKRNMVIDGPHPEEPVVGERINFAIPPGVGLKVANESGDIVQTAHTSLSGGANITIEETGNYTVLIGQMNRRYWPRNVSLTVKSKESTRITIDEEKNIVGEPVEGKVYIGADAASQAEVKVQKPGGDISTYVTDENGSFQFKPLSVGEHVITVSGTKLSKSTKSIDVLNELHADLTTENPVAREEIGVIVRDQGNVLIEDASVVVEETDISGLTNANGKFTFTVDDPGAYTLTINKENSWSIEKEITVSGLMYMNLSRVKAPVGQDVKVNVRNAQGEKIDASLTAFGPNETREELDSNTFSTNRPGNYTLVASKDHYKNVSQDLEIISKDYSIETEVEAGKLMIKVTSNGKPVENMEIVLETSSGDKTLTTDEEGTGTYEISKDEEIVLHANAMNSLKEYAKKSKAVQVYKEYEYGWLIAGVVVVLFLVVVGAFLIYSTYGKEEPEQQKEEKQSSLESV